VELERRLTDAATISTLFGLTVPIADPIVQDKELRKGLDEPEAHLTRTRIKVATDSPYAMEVLVKGPDGRYTARPPKDDDGLAFVSIARGENYAVRLINDSPNDAAVILAIDGLSLFAFSENTDYEHVIVPARTAAMIAGWHRTNQRADEFVITEYARSAAA